MRWLAIILALSATIACAASDAPGSADPHSHMISEGISATGPSIGMRDEELREIGGDRLEQAEPNPDSPGCAEWMLDGISFLSIDGRIETLSVHQNDMPTVEGIRIGSTAAQVRAIYPDAQREAAEYVPEPGHELFVWADAEHASGLRFEIGETQRVTAIHAGGSIRGIGGCF